MATSPDIDAIAERLTAAMPRLDPSAQRTAVILLRQLAPGEPVSLRQLGAAAHLSDVEVAAILDRLRGVSRDDQGRIFGWGGLTVAAVGHRRIHLDGRSL